MRINPIEIEGPWVSGFALDLHTTQSEFLRRGEHGHVEFESRRTEIGEVIYQLKYRNNSQGFSRLVGVARKFVRSLRWPIDLIVPAPPSRIRHKAPVTHQLAVHMAERMGIDASTVCVTKVKETSQLKNIDNPGERAQLLEDAYRCDPAKCAGLNVLVIDDLYQSGATMSAVVNCLYSEGEAAEVYALAFTKTRRS